MLKPNRYRRGAALAFAILLGVAVTGSPTATAAEAGPGDAVAAWLAEVGERPSEPTLRELLNAYESAEDGGARLVAETIANADARLADLVGLPRAAFLERFTAPPEWMRSGELPVEVTAAAATAAAQRLFAARYFEECLTWLDGVVAEDTPSPPLVHYLRAASHHQLVDLGLAAEHAQLLIDNPKGASRRHLALAELIVRDALSSDPESASHIARPMGDVERRLGLGRVGEPEQSLQREVLDALDKLIEEAEEQQRQQQQASAAGAAPAAPSQAAPDSRPSDLKGPGEVDRRDIAQGGDWGSLPPREREKVTQQLSRDFPAYYRDMIEAYFRSLATGETSTDDRPTSSGEEAKP